MNDKELKQWCLEKADNEKYIEFPEEIFQQIDKKQAEDISYVLAASTMMKLPRKEIEFFEWLREADPGIWDDLWNTEGEEPYVVGISFLPKLVKDNGRGFPICDLLENDNYFFTSSHMVDEESKLMVESAKEKFRDNKLLTAAQLLALEISVEPIDIWHFAYKHNLKISTAKQAVKELVDDKVLVHLTDAEHLANFVDF